MYLHIGSEAIVAEKNLIGIFDLDNTSVSKFTREFLRGRQQQGAVITVTEDIPEDAMAIGRARQEVKEGWAEENRRRHGKL